MSGIYIHIPFCSAKCVYCDFYSMPRGNRTDEIERYSNAIVREYNARKDELNGSEVATVYFGGGTPSSLPVDHLTELIRLFHTDSVKELTVEVNPEDVTSHLAEALIASGANRVSMGVQSMVDSELSLIGRRHSSDTVIEAYSHLRDAGFSNISLDLIYGLPGQQLDSWLYSLRTVLELRPEHLSAYALSYEPGTRLYAMLSTGKVKEATQELSEQMYMALCSLASEYGYEHYEIANFGKPGRHSLHNSSYWNLTPYLGLGPGAHSFDGSVRRYNPTNLRTYMTHTESSAIIDEENLDERVNDYVMTALRTSSGIDPKLTLQLFGQEIYDKICATALELIKKGRIITTTAGNFAIPEEKWLLADAITLPFITV